VPGRTQGVPVPEKVVVVAKPSFLVTQQSIFLTKKRCFATKPCRFVRKQSVSGRDNGLLFETKQLAGDTEQSVFVVKQRCLVMRQCGSATRQGVFAPGQRFVVSEESVCVTEIAFSGTEMHLPIAKKSCGEPVTGFSATEFIVDRQYKGIALRTARLLLKTPFTATREQSTMSSLLTRLVFCEFSTG